MRFLTVVDLHECPSQTVRAALSWVRTAPDVKLDLVYVDHDIQQAGYITDPTLREMVLHQWDDTRVSFGAQLDMLRLKVPKPWRGRSRLLYGEPSKALLEVAPHYDAILMGQFSVRASRPTALGCLIHRLARLSPIPVVLLRSPQTESEELRKIA